MKAIVINAGPKRRDSNAQLAKSAMKGAESAGADVEYVMMIRLANAIGKMRFLH